MSVLKVLFVTLLAGSLSISVALFGQRWIDDHPHLAIGAQPKGTRAQVMPDLRLPDLQGREIGSHNWAGKVVVMHFWASWCAPCLVEIASLERLQARYEPGVLQVVSIAIDSPEDIRDFLASRSLNYQVLLGGPPEVELAERFGNRTLALPFTALFDSHGRLVFSQAGEVADEVLATPLGALLPTISQPATQTPTNPGLSQESSS
jgi:thiol-disulfide isomerase/thioredoxin